MKNIGTQREKAYQKLRDAITYGGLKPGERLVEERICKMFAVGRTPLREALRQLQMEGCVEVLSNKGAIVSKMSVQDVENIYDLIAILEGFAIETAAKNNQTEDLRELKIIHGDLKEAGRTKDYRKWIDKNTLLHGYFPLRSDNRHLYEMWESLRKRVYRYRFIAINIPNHMEEYISAHEEILAAIVNKQPVEAGAAMKKHVLYVKEVISDFLKHSPEF